MVVGWTIDIEENKENVKRQPKRNPILNKSRMLFSGLANSGCHRALFENKNGHRNKLSHLIYYHEYVQFEYSFPF